jgi:hypothetical protein
MKHLFLIALFVLSSCGQQQRDDSDPFGSTDQGQKDKEISQKSFEEKCAKTKGGILKFQKSLCFHTPHQVVMTKEELEKEFKDKPVLLIKMGIVAEGSLIWADVKGGQKVNFYLNEVRHSHVHNGIMAPLRISAGQVTMSIMSSSYDHAMAFIGECFDRKGNTPCDRVLQEGF